MKRRAFFKNLIGATAAIAIGPALLAQVEEHEYKTEAKAPARPPEKLFTNNQGLWVFRDEKLVAWSALDYCAIHFDAPIDVTRLDETDPDPEIFKRQPEITLEVDDLHVIDSNAFETDDGRVQIVFALRDEKGGLLRKLASDAIWLTLGFHMEVGEYVKRSASFKCYGKPDIEISPI